MRSITARYNSEGLVTAVRVYCSRGVMVVEGMGEQGDGYILGADGNVGEEFSDQGQGRGSGVGGLGWLLSGET